MRPASTQLGVMWRVSVAVVGWCAAACGSHPLTDYHTLVKAGMSSASIEQLKKLDTSDIETLQEVKLKEAGITDDTAVALVAGAHRHQHPFISADSSISLAGAGFTENQILDIAGTDQLDSISSDAVTLRLIGLSDPSVQILLKRYLEREPTLSTGAIAHLKNVGLTEEQVMQRVESGMSDAQAEKETLARQTARNHYGTSFVRIHGRKRR